MATPVSLTTAQQMVIADLQASRTPWASTVDGSNRQFSSDAQITSAILNADAEICNQIVNTIGHPYLPQFLVVSNGLPNGSPLPPSCGIPVKVLVQGQGTSIAFAYTAVNTTANTITLSDPTGELVTGNAVQLTTTGTLPSPIVIQVTYYVINQGTPAYKFATTYQNALAGTAVDLTTTGSGNSTVTFPFVLGIRGKSADEMTEASENPELFGAGYDQFWFIDGNILYTSAAYAAVIYADFTLTNSPQAPAPYLDAVVAGAISRLYQDGGDEQMSAYYGQIFNQHLGIVQNQTSVVPAFRQDQPMLPPPPQ